ncbi:uncharacterized protein BDR25DRAFT_360163 [Lindgomyces ingoldianus]|uniref:Uncharacterized protein n=1 Tax=Lindgomyces ingoldianus TaxID=673940 RepID=A0ACB6QGJ7_9PLEO|nr:uncharacterized protein BDR25DRAFT_360163 [Lindgomyces ingoldianus]KAF2466016.1 hypothetical protein BDR25DRAFT_360163 [Lindgomyces ingoldianus]
MTCIWITPYTFSILRAVNSTNCFQGSQTGENSTPRVHRAQASSRATIHQKSRVAEPTTAHAYALEPLLLSSVTSDLKISRRSKWQPCRPSVRDFTPILVLLIQFHDAYVLDAQDLTVLMDKQTNSSKADTWSQIGFFRVFFTVIESPTPSPMSFFELDDSFPSSTPSTATPLTHHSYSSMTGVTAPMISPGKYPSYANITMTPQ